jgi:hypothetical protein
VIPVNANGTGRYRWFKAFVFLDLYEQIASGYYNLPFANLNPYPVAECVLASRQLIWSR